MIKFSKLLLATVLVAGSAFAQPEVKKEKVPNDWYQLDAATTGYQGISLDKAYSLLQSKKIKSNRIVVAVIDTGIDTLHEDLKSVLWTNPKEIPGNGIDDDRNGYIDDVHGWNFIGGKDGRNLKEDSYEAARVYHKLKLKWEEKTSADAFTDKDKTEFAEYQRAKQKIVGDLDPVQSKMMASMYVKLSAGDTIIRKAINKEEYTIKDMEVYQPQDLNAKAAKSILVNISKANNSTDITNKQLLDELNDEIRKIESASKPPEEYRRNIVQDDENNINDIHYGNNDIMASTPFHGTHCSGIIAASRNNDKGIKGIADNVRIMMIRAFSDGDEHDKDIANAIRYAVNNGARIISMSFGKEFSPEKHWVDDALRYAEAKGVLLVHAAGNDAQNVDTAYYFPNPVFIDGKGRATNVITVGASGNMKNGGLTASFSNYGKAEVDLFAPGVGIYSTIPGGTTYGNASGTSMACPVVAGVAALILEHYPTLTPQQLKFVIEKSATAPAEKVNIPGTDEKVYLNELCRTGGLVNAYEAVKLAGTLKTVKPKTELPKPKMKKSKVG